MKIGITGGIGSGKSYVCRLLEARGYAVYDCDSAAKRLIRTSPFIRRRLTALIGPQTYFKESGDRRQETGDGSQESGEYFLNKKAVAEFLLESEDNARAIDRIVHPAVFRDFIQSGMEWMESAIIYESGIYRLVDRVIVVTAPEELRIQRVMARDKISREKVLEWMGRQWPQEEVRRRADFEIINDGHADIEQQLNNIIEQCKKQF
ncbi:MAG: dephospho-CoA kinase [Prevotella sp.]|nr:dephospho-CoA kinase [Prevotella sp.]